MSAKGTARSAGQLSSKSEFADWVDAFDGEFDHVYRSLRRHGVAVADAEDLAQDVFVVMWRRRDHYDPERPLRAWLAGIAFRVAYEYRRRRGREVPSGFVDAQDEGARPDDRIASAAARRLVRASLEKMPAKYSALIVMHDLDGVSMHQIAAELRVPLQTAYSRLRTARRAFAKTVRRLQTLANFGAPIATTTEALLEAERTAPPAPAEARRRVLKRVRAAIPAPELPPAAPASHPWVGAVLGVAAGVLVIGGGVVASRSAIRPSASPATATATAAGPAPGAGSLTRGLAGSWRLDEPAGSRIARDGVGGAHCHLRRYLDPATDWVPGQVGGALHFRAHGWLECPPAAFQGRISSEMTLATWVWRDLHPTGLRAILSRQFATGDRDYFFIGFRDDTLIVNSHLRSGTIDWRMPTGMRGWMHVAATFDRQGTIRLVVDGQEVARTTGKPISLGGGENPLLMGAGFNGPPPMQASQRFQGLIDEVLLYDRPLADDELRALAAGTRPGI